MHTGNQGAVAMQAGRGGNHLPHPAGHQAEDRVQSQESRPVVHEDSQADAGWDDGQHHNYTRSQDAAELEEHVSAKSAAHCGTYKDLGRQRPPGRQCQLDMVKLLKNGGTSR